MSGLINQAKRWKCRVLNLKLKAVLLAEGLKFGIANINIKTSRGPEVLRKLEFHPSHETERKMLCNNVSRTYASR